MTRLRFRCSAVDGVGRQCDLADPADNAGHTGPHSNRWGQWALLDVPVEPRDEPWRVQIRDEPGWFVTRARLERLLHPGVLMYAISPSTLGHPKGLAADGAEIRRRLVDGIVTGLEKGVGAEPRDWERAAEPLFTAAWDELTPAEQTTDRLRQAQNPAHDLAEWERAKRIADTVRLVEQVKPLDDPDAVTQPFDPEAPVETTEGRLDLFERGYADGLAAGRKEALEEPRAVETVVVHAGDPDARAAAFNEGFDEGRQAGVEDGWQQAQTAIDRDLDAIRSGAGVRRARAEVAGTFRRHFARAAHAAALETGDVCGERGPFDRGSGHRDEYALDDAVTCTKPAGHPGTDPAAHRYVGPDGAVAEWAT